MQDHQNNIGKVFETFNLHLIIARFHSWVKTAREGVTWEDRVIDLVLSLYDGSDLVTIRRDLILIKAIGIVNEKIVDTEK